MKQQMNHRGAPGFLFAMVALLAVLAISAAACSSPEPTSPPLSEVSSIYEGHEDVNETADAHVSTVI